MEPKGIGQTESRSEIMKLSYTEIRQSCRSIKVSMSMQTGNNSPRSQVKVFPITYYQIPLTGDARTYTWDLLLAE